MKRLSYFILLLVVLLSCKKSAKDIDPSKIQTACEWQEAYQIVLDEFYECTLDQIKKKEIRDTIATQLNRKFEKKRLFYDKLLKEILHLPIENKAIDMNLPCNKEKQAQLDLKYKMLYDSLLFVVSPNYVAEEYLKALDNRDYDRASFVSLPDRKHYFDPLKQMDWDPGLYKIENIDCIIESELARCTFCCSKDTFWKDVKIKHYEGRWYYSPPKEEIMPPEDTIH